MVTPNRAAPAALRVWLFVALLASVAVAGGIVATTQLTRLPGRAGHITLPWLALTAAMVAASMLTVTLPFRGGTFTIGLLEIPIVVGVVYLTPVELVLSVVTGQLIVSLSRRRPPSRIAYNVTCFVCAALAALGVYRAVLGSSSPVALRGWAAAALAALAADLVMNSTLAVVIALNTRRSSIGEFKLAVRSTLVCLPVVTIMILITVTLTWVSQIADLLLVGLGAIVLITQRSITVLRRRQMTFNRLAEDLEAAGELLVVDDILLTLLNNAQETLGAQIAELTVSEGDGFARYGLDPQGSLVRRTLAQLDQLEVLAIRNGKDGVLAAAKDRQPEIRAALAERGFRDAVAAMRGSQFGTPATFVVANREGPVSFGEDDLNLVRSLSAHSALVIRAARQQEHLHREAIARQHDSLHDGLTGLANRTLLHQVVGEALVNRPAGYRVVVMLMDLDGFKEINDTLGHHTGDSVLREVASRLAAASGESGWVARLGGDEFALVFSDLPDLESIRGRADAMLAEVFAPILLDGLFLSVRASMGVSIAPDHGDDCSVLLRRADVAMYAAKSSGAGAQIYDPASDHYTTRRLTLATELLAAPQGNELEVWYQPQADLATGRITECEALSRWTHSVFGQIPPDEFIPLAEQSGSIGPLTWRVLETATARLQEWHANGLSVGMAVNIAARSLLEVALVERLATMLSGAGLDPTWLTLELTESSIVADEVRSGRVLAALGDLGVRIALDDFGTGHSSLTRLRRLPINVVKIDKSFVRSMSVDAGDLAIVRSTVELAHSLGHVVVAEGVEDQVTWDRLADLGCDRAQGFFLAEPMSAAKTDEWLRQRLTAGPVVSPAPVAEISLRWPPGPRAVRDGAISELVGWPRVG